MVSGIYEYKFASGDRYIGQAIDIEKRWDQHVSKMQKGTHTKNIQYAYDRYGLPEFYVLKYCHPHYLDAMEAVCIHMTRPNLNGVQPKHYITRDMEVEVEDRVLNQQLFETFHELWNTSKDLEAMEEAATTLSEKLEQSKKRVIQVAKEVQPKELKDYVVNIETKLTRVEHDLRKTTAQLKQAEDRIYNYSRLPWYKRIFQTI